MSTPPTTADPPVPAGSTSTPYAGTPVPTLDDLGLLAPEERRVYRGVDWTFYERVLEVVDGRRGFRVAFDGRDVEIMPTGFIHEDMADFGWRLIEIVTEELEILSRSLGKTTWMRPELNRGIESDQCFFFLPEKLEAIAAAIARSSRDLGDYPNPDLAIEVDISQPKIDRPGIYAALKVKEIWRFTAIGLTIERLNDEGRYDAVDSSGFLPIRSDEVVRWVLQEDRSNLLAWKRRLRAWVQAELVPRQAH